MKRKLSADSLEKGEEADPKQLDNLGFIFHWGLYSVPGFMKVLRKERNGTEWYLKRLTEESTFRPIAGCKETKEFHLKQYGDSSYFDLASQFTAANWNSDEWMLLCKACGASYVILTAKHHDGYCLWPTTTTKNNVVLSGPRRNILAEFKAAATRHGLRFGIYYSWCEFNKTVTKQYVDEVIVPQVDELLGYGPSILWFDGHWEIKSKYANQRLTELCNKVKETGCIINDRIPGTAEDASVLGNSSYRVYGDRTILESDPLVPWESIHTIGNSWGVNKYNNTYKSSDQLLAMYRKVADTGGKFLLNFGPDEKGDLDVKEVEIVLELKSKLCA